MLSPSPAVLLVLGALAPVHHAGELSLQPYLFQTFDGSFHKAELGHLWVRDNRDAASDRLIELAFVRFKSFAPKPRSPVVFLSGGPGVPGTAIGRVPVYHRLFERIQSTADVILLDQRGVGMSSPTLCPEGPPPPAGVFATESSFREALTTRAHACADYWRGEGLDLAAFTTSASADDVEDLRVALQEDKISLLAQSYGTAVALAAIRRHGAHLDRVALAGSEGPDQNLHLPLVFDFALRRISILAAAASGLNGAFPDTFEEFQHVLDRIDKEPLLVPIQMERTKQMITVPVGAFLLRLAVRNMLSSGPQADRIPALVYSVAHGDATLLIPAVQNLYNFLSSGFSVVQFAVSCSDGWSAERRRLAEAQASLSVFGDAPFIHLDPRLCDAVGGASPQGDSLLPVRSSVPTLLVSGTLDSNTPASQSEEIRWGLSNGESLRVDNGFHETLHSPDVQTIVTGFLSGADVGDRAIRLPPPSFLTIEKAKAARAR